VSLPKAENQQESSITEQALASLPKFLVPWSLYGDLIKGKQTFLLLYTVFFAYLISAWPSRLSAIDLAWLVVSLFFAISGSTLLNMYIDRDIDAIMERTKKRSLPSYRVHPTAVLVQGLVFSIFGILTAGLFLNLITMIIVFLGFFFDAIVYSLLLKRRTRFSILFGGIAGGLPAVAARTAVIGTVDLVAVLMATFVLFWIPLHILTLALIPKNLEGYTKACVPMWPVVSGKISTTRMITISAIVMSVTIFLTGIALNIQMILLLPLIAFSLFLIYLSVANLMKPTEKKTFKIFKLASMYMAFSFLWLFLGVAIPTILK
jgi:protoheme IX farnesyltransferase